MLRLTNRMSLVCLVVSLAGATLAHADHWHHGNRLAGLASEMEQHGRELLCEFQVTYGSTPQYRALQTSARQLITRAGRLHSLAHTGAHPAVLRSSLGGAASSFRYLVQKVQAADLSQGTSRGHSHNRQVQRLLGCVDRLICQANDLVGSSVSPVSPVHIHPGVTWHRTQVGAHRSHEVAAPDRFPLPFIR